MILHPDERIKYSSMFESMIGFGCVLGPVVGSILYYLVGYFLMFVIASISLSIFIIPMMVSIPSNINMNDENEIEEDQDLDSQSQIESKISYYRLLADPLIFLSIIAHVLLIASYSYFEPLLSFRLDDFTDSIVIQGLIFSLLVVGYPIMAIFVPYFSKYASPIKLITFGLF